MCFWRVLLLFALLSQCAAIFFDRFLLVITDELRIRANEAPIEDPTWQPAIIIGFDRLEITHRNARLFRDVTQSNPPRLACEPQFFSNALHHFQTQSSLDKAEHVRTSKSSLFSQV